jgi:hypothetical protein
MEGANTPLLCDFTKPCNQRLMEGVELVEFRLDVYFPVPLGDRAFDNGSRRVCVVFQQFGFAITIPRKVEAAVEVGVCAPPAFLDESLSRCGQEQPTEVSARNQVISEVQAHAVKFFGRLIQRFDLSLAEAVRDIFAPVEELAGCS